MRARIDEKGRISLCARVRGERELRIGRKWKGKKGEKKSDLRWALPVLRSDVRLTTSVDLSCDMCRRVYRDWRGTQTKRAQRLFGSARIILVFTVSFLSQVKKKYIEGKEKNAEFSRARPWNDFRCSANADDCDCLRWWYPVVFWKNLFHLSTVFLDLGRENSPFFLERTMD